MSDETCANCKYFDEIVCRRYPPQYYTKVWSETCGHHGELREEIMSNVNQAFPEVAADSWCGEWEQKK